MEILYVQTEKLMLSLSGEAKATEENETEIICEEKCISRSKSVMLCHSVPYGITLVNLSDLNICVLADGEKTEITYLNGENKIGSGAVVFDRVGINTVEVFAGGELCVSIKLEVCPGMAMYKTHFRDMRNRISKITQNEVSEFLYKMCVKYKLKPAGAKNIYEIFNSLHERFYRDFEKSIQKKRYREGAEETIIVRKDKNSKKKNKRYKKINVYNTEENRKIKYAAQILGEITVEFLPFCTELIILSEKLKRIVSESVISEVTAQEGVCNSKEISKICRFTEAVRAYGSFVSKDSKCVADMYNFYCFAEINRILSELYRPLENKIFKTDEKIFVADIYEKRQVRYANTENDNIITVTYNPENEGPKIYIQLNRKERISSHRRVYGFDIMYKDSAGESENNLAYAYKSKIKGAKSNLPLLSGAYILCFEADSESFENLIPLSPYDTRKMEEWIKAVVGDKDLNEYPPFEDVISQDVCREDFENRDVMVAVVKTKNQFSTNIKEKFYYIPARFVEENKNVRYVALYQSKTLFGGEAGIKYFGEVEKMSLVPRYKIREIESNSDEMYYRFDIKNWEVLTKPIKPKDFAEVCTFTNMFLLKSAEELPELYIGSFTEYVLKCALKELKNREEINFMLLNAYFKCRKDDIAVYLKSGEAVKLHPGGNNLHLAAHEIDKLLS